MRQPSVVRHDAASVTRNRVVAFLAASCLAMLCMVLMERKYSPNKIRHDVLLESSSGRRKYSPHCRADLPGCCPSTVRQILFLHLPKSGGTAVGSWLRANAPQMPFLGPVGIPGGNFFECQCAPLRRAAKGLPFFNFSALGEGEGGSIFEGHWDASVEEVLHQTSLIEWSTTAVVVSARAPLQRATSLYHYYRAAGSRQYANETLRGYLARPELDNPLARTLAGAGVNGATCGCADVCSSAGPGAAATCRTTRPTTLGTDGVSGGGALLQPAISFLEQRACAVFVAERPLESAAYLAHALGVKPGSKLVPIRNENTFASMAAKRDTETAVPRTPEGWAVTPEIAGSFDTRNAADVALHAIAGRILDEQMTALRAARS